MKNTERPRRPRTEGKDKPVSSRSDNRSDRKSFSDDKRPYAGNRTDSAARPKGNFPKKEGFERSFSEPRFGDKRPFGAKKPFTSEPSERPFEKKATDGKRSYGEKKSFGGDRPARPYEKRDGGGFENKRPYGEKKSFGADRPERPFARREEGGFENKRPYGEKKSFGGDRPDRPFVKREEGGFENKRPYGDRKPSTGDRPERPFEKREESGSDERRPFDREKPRFERRDNRSEERSFGRGAKVEKRENQASSSKPFSPNYDLDKMKNSLPPRIQKKVEREERERDSDRLIRLNRYISNAGIASRRDADELIASGQITVNGKEIVEMGYKVKPSDVVKYGKKILNREKLVYLLLNKPKDFITTTEDPNERKTVMDLVANACEERVYPVGRLDRNTTGLLLLTNDGELAEKLSHPSNEIRKIYQVELDKPITTEHFDAIKEGIELEDGFVKPDDLGLVTPDAEVIGIEIHSGKNRIVRRIFESFGYEVLKLDRTTYAGLNKKDLPRSKWRFLTEKEVIRLKYMI